MAGGKQNSDQRTFLNGFKKKKKTVHEKLMQCKLQCP
jgi:hypothetical protein